MNERIQELAEHCDFYVGNEHYNECHEEKQRLWVEKFAELIVQECGVALSPMLRDMVSRGQAFDLIKQHFGVTE